MTIDGENMSYKVNDKDLGVLFTSKQFMTNQVYACVFITDIAD